MPVIPLIARLLTRSSDVLEFGSGNSTIWLAKQALSVMSVENDQNWYAKITGRLTDLGLRNAVVRYAPGDAYYDLDWVRGARFDFIVVDGSYQWRCVEAALPYLRENGILYLDNSDADKDRCFYPDPSMHQVAQDILEKYASNSRDRVS